MIVVVHMRTGISYADDSVIVSLLQEQDQGHGPVVGDFVTWCNEFNLHKRGKTKDMFIGFGRGKVRSGLTNINGVDIEVTGNYKYLGSVIDDKLSFEANVSMVCKKIPAENVFFFFFEENENIQCLYQDDDFILQDFH